MADSIPLPCINDQLEESNYVSTLDLVSELEILSSLSQSPGEDSFHNPEGVNIKIVVMLMQLTCGISAAYAIEP